MDLLNSLSLSLSMDISIYITSHCCLSLLTCITFRNVTLLLKNLLKLIHPSQTPFFTINAYLILKEEREIRYGHETKLRLSLL